MRENPYVNYFLNPYEAEAFLIGFRAESALSGKTIEECAMLFLGNYLKSKLKRWK